MAEEVLTIKINYDGKDAQTGLSSLRRDIEAVSTAASSQGFTNLKGVASSMKAFADSASNLKGIGPALSDVALNTEKLFNSFQSFNISAFSSRMAQISGIFKTMGDSVGSLNKFTSSLERIKKLAADPNLAQNFQNLSQQISMFAKNVASSMSDEVLNKFERIGSAMSGMAAGISGMPALKDFFRRST